MVLLRPLRLLQRLGEPLSILLHKHTLCTKTDRGSSSLCSSLRGLNSTIQLRIDSSQPARACPWKFHNAAHTIDHVTFHHPLFLEGSALNSFPVLKHKRSPFSIRDVHFWRNPTNVLALPVIIRL